MNIRPRLTRVMKVDSKFIPGVFQDDRKSTRQLRKAEEKKKKKA